MEQMNFTCCFTGHRQISPEAMAAVYEELKRVVDILIRSGVRNFRTGGALGFDTLAALTVLDRRKEDPSIKLELCIPCANQPSGWGDEDKALYEYIKSQADKVTVLRERFVKGCMHVRNRYMVNGSHYCVAYCVRREGGTAYTVDYAQKNGVKVIDLALLINNRSDDPCFLL